VGDFEAGNILCSDRLERRKVVEEKKEGGGENLIVEENGKSRPNKRSVPQYVDVDRR